MPGVCPDAPARETVMSQLRPSVPDSQGRFGPYGGRYVPKR